MNNKIKTETYQEPTYERVQTGARDTTKYVTTDGKEFWDQEDAEEHQDELDAKEFKQNNLKSYQTKPLFPKSHGCWYRIGSYRDVFLAFNDDRDYHSGYDVYIDGQNMGEIDELLNQEFTFAPNWYLIFTQYNSSNDWVVAVYLRSKEVVIEQLNEAVSEFKNQIPLDEE